MSHPSIAKLLNLTSPPIAIAFLDAAPDGVKHSASQEAAGCGYWRRAAEGEVFYTVADDHKRCPIGAHTHNVPLTPDEQQELMSLVGTMVGLQYLKMEDVPKIPTRKSPLNVTVYSPLAAAPVHPDVVLVRGNARQLMLLSEAAESAGFAGTGPAMGRPTCAVLPEAINTHLTSASFGCVGNRVYTGAADTDAYFAIPGDRLAALEERLPVIIRATIVLEKFHQERAAAL